MNLRTALRVVEPTNVAFVGAGGKTTAIFRLARELPTPVIITTTTHIGTWQIPQADCWITDPTLLEGEVASGNKVIVFTGKSVNDDRAAGLSPREIDDLQHFVKAKGWSLLIEADGARRLPLKAPGQNEPVIPPWVENVVVVAGLTGLNKPLGNAHIHRYQIFSQLSGLPLGDPVGEDALLKVLLDPSGGLKSIQENARKIVFLNQADDESLTAAANQLTSKLLDGYDVAIYGRLNNEPKDEIIASKEPIAGIILAAGGSTRFGKPKQELLWRGKTFLENVVSVADMAELRCVYLIQSNNAYSQYISNVNKNNFISLNNQNWQLGQSTSIRLGLQSLPPNTGGAVFLLGDQPQIPAQLIQDLVDRHAATHAPIIAPFVGGRRANPVLFDRCTFPDLLALEGDTGGRGLIAKYPVEYIPWNDESILLDVDTPEDYGRLLEFE
ncbi:MAG TPA: selenium cofactor biosynthesis protein YqeC [Longilinea sp.]|nr:selenium cofactor biosynthesis protein YqeC [Longilinea sp.]